MKSQTRKLLSKILRESFIAPIGVTFKSSNPMPSGGERKSHAKGSGGYDLEGLVTYETGDDPRDIDWRSTAQAGGGSIYVAQYMEPRDVKVFVLVDISKSMDFGTSRTTKRMLAGELAASIIQSAEEGGDRAGSIIFGNSKVHVLHKANAPKLVLVPSLISILETEDATSAGLNTTASGLNQALMMLPNGRNIIYIISDFFNFNENDHAALKRLSTRNQITCIHVSDIRERVLPKTFGYISMYDIATKQNLIVWSNARTNAKFEANFLDHITKLKNVMQALKIPLVEFVTNEGKSARNKFMRMLINHQMTKAKS